MNAQHLDELLEGYLLDELSEQQCADLAQALRADTDARRRLVDLAVLDAHLHRLHSMRPGTAQRPSFFSTRWLAIAAGLLLLIGGAVAALLVARRPAETQALVGTVLVDGQSRDRIPDGAAITVSGSTPATLRLPDGSQATLDPATQLTVRGRVGDVRQVIQLASGGGQFSGTHSPGQFRIDTSLGSITVIGTRFTAHFRPPGTLSVAVAAGAVRVDGEGKSYTLSAGQSRTWGPTPGTAPQRVPRTVNGTIRSVDTRARTLVLATAQQEATYRMPRTLVITIDGRWAQPADLHPGMEVSITTFENSNEARELHSPATQPRK
jgi:ferric-dicitrate binding protein FerR (iron transport regulator)